MHYNQQKFYQVHGMHCVCVFHFNLLFAGQKKPGRCYYDRASAQQVFLLTRSLYTQSCYVIIIISFTDRHTITIGYKRSFPYR